MDKPKPATDPRVAAEIIKLRMQGWAVSRLAEEYDMTVREVIGILETRPFSDAAVLGNAL